MASKRSKRKTTKTTKKNSSKTLTKLEERIAELKEMLPSQMDWGSSDEQEVARRQLRALQFPTSVKNLQASNKNHKIHSCFLSKSDDSDRSYFVEIIDLKEGLYFSTSPDFAVNGLGTCKHTESVLFHLEKRFPRLFKQAAERGSPFVHLIVKKGSLRLHHQPMTKVPKELKACFKTNGEPRTNRQPEQVIEIAKNCDPSLVFISGQVGPWLQKKAHQKEAVLLRRVYEQKVHSGEFPAHETKLPLFPYQREGMLHLAFKERAMVADEMGLGKTIQGISAAALIHRLGKAKRCLIVAPASLKAEWEEQIEKFTELPSEIVYGNRTQRNAIYRDPTGFFIVANYEQIRSDSLDINTYLQPDIVILDEAQRIKNWTSKTAQAIKRLESRYAFVLTGTPIENRIDELYSIMEFLDPTILGSLFRFNRDHYELGDKGKPIGYKNLDLLREKIEPLVLRRRKFHVETELPSRSDSNRFISLSAGQKEAYAEPEEVARRLLHASQSRKLRKQEHETLMINLGMMRMICDTLFILDKETKTSPKLDELIPILDEALLDPETKIIIFSEWIGMLELIRAHLDKYSIGYAWHTGSVPQKKRRVEIKAFKEDPECKIILSTESGGAGLNLQNASMVINMDLPWNPAKLEQRIARAWRKGQTRPVQVINIIAQDSIEHAMLGKLASKQGLADKVLDGIGDENSMKIGGGKNSFLAKLTQDLSTFAPTSSAAKAIPKTPADIAVATAEKMVQELGDELLFCEEHFIGDDKLSKLFLVVKDLHKVNRSKLIESIKPFYPQLKSGNSPEAWMEENILIIDETAHKSMLQLQKAGILKIGTRARRNLLNPNKSTNIVPTLNAEQVQQVELSKKTATEQLKAAKALIEAKLEHLAKAHLQNALLEKIKIKAIESFSTPPTTFDQLSQEPFSNMIDEAIIPLLNQTSLHEALEKLNTL